MVVGLDESEPSSYALQWTLQHFFPSGQPRLYHLVVVTAKPAAVCNVGLTGPGTSLPPLPLVLLLPSILIAWWCGLEAWIWTASDASPLTGGTLTPRRRHLSLLSTAAPPPQRSPETRAGSMTAAARPLPLRVSLRGGSNP
jgi:hypothetical protein